MKTKSLNLTGKFLSLFVVLFYFGRLQAQLPVKEDDRTSITYGGMLNDHLVFYVTVDNPMKEKMQCQLADQNHDVLFRETFTNARFEKKFLVLRDDMNDVTFLINGKNYIYSRNFSIVSKVVEEITVKEIGN